MTVWGLGGPGGVRFLLGPDLKLLSRLPGAFRGLPWSTVAIRATSRPVARAPSRGGSWQAHRWSVGLRSLSPGGHGSWLVEAERTGLWSARSLAPRPPDAQLPRGPDWHPAALPLQEQWVTPGPGLGRWYADSWEMGLHQQQRQEGASGGAGGSGHGPRGSGFGQQPDGPAWRAMLLTSRWTSLPRVCVCVYTHTSLPRVCVHGHTHTHKLTLCLRTCTHTHTHEGGPSAP